MASIRKSFNFRNGVQVDDNNFVINANGLVGIGTSIPTEILDVYGGNIRTDDTVYSKNLNSSNLNVSGISTVDNILVESYINVGVTSITSGIITSYSGIVTYYGDGGRLLNLPTSQWLDIDVGLGFTSIYAQGFVGIATMDPRYVFQVGGYYTNLSNPETLHNGVGINSVGDIFATGRVTAGEIAGIGSLITVINASNISLGTLDTNRLPQQIETNNINLSGVATAVSFYGETFFGNLVGVADTANDVTPTSSITIEGLNVGVATVRTTLHVEDSIGVGTDSGTAKIHIYDTNASTLRVTSENQNSSIIFGRNLSGQNGNAELRFGNTDSGYQYSSSESTDIINYDSGNYNYYNNVSGGFGNFNWIRGLNNVQMTLTSSGNLGIGYTNPSNKLEVAGSTFINSNLEVGGNLDVNGNVTFTGFVNIGTDVEFPGEITARKVGIATNSPTYDFQIGTNPLSANGGVGISSSGIVIAKDIRVRNINSTGIITCVSIDLSGAIETLGNVTANSFIGDGSLLTGLNASNISSGTISDTLLPSSITISGSFSAGPISGSSIQLSGPITGSSLSVSGIATAITFKGQSIELTSNFVGVAGTFSSNLYASNFSVTGSINSNSITSNNATFTQLNTGSLSVTGSPSFSNATITNLNSTNLNVSGVSTLSSLEVTNVVSSDVGQFLEITTNSINIPAGTDGDVYNPTGTSALTIYFNRTTSELSFVVDDPVVGITSTTLSLT